MSAGTTVSTSRPDVVAVFTGLGDGNLSHHRPHDPRQLAAARGAVAAAIGVTAHDLHFMDQAHGARVARVTAETPRGAEHRDVDGLVTSEADRALVVLVADCVPVLLASADGTIAVAHAGRQGVVSGIVAATVRAMEAPAESVAAVLGPAIRGCCYEVPSTMQAEVVGDNPAARARTTWGTPSLDLPAAVVGQLRALGVRDVRDGAGCTRCGDGSFSHRRDPRGGRQAGVIVRHAVAA